MKTVLIIAFIVAFVVIVINIAILFSDNWKFDESIFGITVEEKPEIIEFTPPVSLFKITQTAESKPMTGKSTLINLTFEFIPELEELYNEIRVNNEMQKKVVVIPVFTDSAYSEPGFYTYYRGDCDSSCLTTVIEPKPVLGFHSSTHSVHVLRLLGYDTITDIDIDKNPDILSEYDKVIMLHSEYVTRNEFNAVTNHPRVMFLHPNALYAEVTVDYVQNTITLVRGHGYPSKDISNGFNWEFDNTHPYEFDTECKTWEFYEIDNGVMLDCYPAIVIYRDKSLLMAIKEF